MEDQSIETESVGIFSGIHPSYLEDTRQRVSLIEKFLAGDRSRSSLIETADAIGLSPSRTGRLIRSYELHRDPKLISGDGRRQSRSASTSGRDLVRQAIDATISSLGTTADAREIEQAVASACEDAAVAPPSTQLIWKSLAKARRKNREPATNVSPKLLVGRVWFQLPVELEQGTVERPEALIALRLPDKSIWRQAPDWMSPQRTQPSRQERHDGQTQGSAHGGADRNGPRAGWPEAHQEPAARVCPSCPRQPCGIRHALFDGRGEETPSD